MRRTIAVWLSLLSVGLGAETKPKPSGKPPELATLRWNNGESIRGDILQASPGDLSWKSPLFEEPLVVSWSALRRIDRTIPSVASPDAFSIAFRNGDVICGDVIGITDTTIQLRSSRHGEVAVKRSEVLSIRRLRGAGLIYSGPVADVGWGTAASRKNDSNDRGMEPREMKAPSLVAGPTGSLVMPYWNGGAYLKATLPPKVDVEFVVHSSTRPEFQFSFEGDPKERLKIETWDDQLVLVAAKKFKLIRKIADEDREIGLRICWDRAARTCSVYSRSGEALIDWQFTEDSESKGSAVVLQSRGRDLSLDLLKIRPWNGQPPAKIDVNKPRVEIADGRILDGQVTEGSGDSIKVAETTKEEETLVPIEQLEAIIFSSEEPKPAEKPAQITFADGTRLSGRAVSVTDGIAVIETDIAEKAFTSKTENLRQWLIRVPAAPDAKPDVPLNKLDRIVVDDVTFHGTLSGAGDNSPRWLPVGGLKPTKPARSLAGDIIRAVPANDASSATTALVYTSAGDVLPSSVRTFDGKQVQLESTIIQNTDLPTEFLDAIQFSVGTQNDIRGFNAPGWRVIKGGEEKVHRDGGRLQMDPDSSIGHAAGMLSGEIEFKLVSSSFATVRLRMFCSGTEESKSVNLVLMRMSNRITSGLEGQENQFDDETQTMVSNSDPIPVRLVIKNKDVSLYINGGLVQKFPISAARRSGTGLIIEPASMWGNPVNSIELADFSAKAEPGLAWLPQINAETKAMALTVPRFRKETPPRHVLLAANGDLLRGEIESATATHFGFRSGLETLRVPRDRVRAAIWLKKPDPTAPSRDVQSPTQQKLDQTITTHTTYGTSSIESLISFIQEQVGDLKIKLPKQSPRRNVQMRFGGQTVGEALEEICGFFGLAYRVDKDGSVVIEAPNQAPKGLTQKVYWMKGESLPVDGTVQTFLAAKGVRFSEGASVIWRPTQHQLTMTNTAEGHAKLAALIESELGGGIGSPTHWLILTNGGRIGMVVDKFDPEWIFGRHPVYGECKVPMKDVYAVRTSPPEPTASMRSLGNWHLTYAPEPVLPEASGDNSPTLGKEAKSFKLAMLAGGEFDLAKEKGKVVVLDFWATWCGPCIKSLPGLIGAMSGFPSDRVKFIGVNQGEPPAQVKSFLETRGWKLDVALDASQGVARQYEVEGIPHTVVIAPDGKIAFVKSGYSPDGETEIANAVKKLLGEKSSDSAPASSAQ